MPNHRFSLGSKIVECQFVSAGYLARKTGLTTRYWTQRAIRGEVPGAFQPSGYRGAWRFDLEEFENWWNGTKVLKCPATSTSAAKRGGVESSFVEKNTGEAYKRLLGR